MYHSEVKHLPKVDHQFAEMDAPAKVLLKAAALIEDRGLAKHIQCDAEGKLCIYGALVLADGGIPYSIGSRFESTGIFAGSTPAAMEAVRRVEKDLGTNDASIWNNAEERTQADVVAKLRAVALGL